MAAKLPPIYYVRHGQTDWNAELRFQGQRDIPLNETGRVQAIGNGRKLAGLLGDAAGFGFVASPLSRTRETMELIRAELGLPRDGYRLDPLLIEASYGELEGTTLPEFKLADPKAHRLRKKQRWEFRPPRGESHADVSIRVRPFLEGLDQPLIVAGHGVVGRVLRHLLAGISPEDAANFVFPQDRIFVWKDGSETMI